MVLKNCVVMGMELGVGPCAQVHNFSPCIISPALIPGFYSQEREWVGLKEPVNQAFPEFFHHQAMEQGSSQVVKG